MVNQFLLKTAKEHYENARKNVSGRPAWDKLDPNCPYDQGMKEHAYKEAEKILAKRLRDETDRDFDESLMPGGFK